LGKNVLDAAIPTPPQAYSKCATDFLRHIRPKKHFWDDDGHNAPIFIAVAPLESGAMYVPP
jgi:hypothetical protein